MKLTIQLDDDVCEAYTARLRPTQTLEQALVLQLTHFVACDPRDRTIILSAEERQQLERLTTQLPLKNAAALIEAVSALAELKIGRIRLRWTPKQLSELKSRAERWRMPIDAYLEQVVTQIAEDVWHVFPQEGRMLPAAPPAQSSQAPAVEKA